MRRRAATAGMVAGVAAVLAACGGSASQTTGSNPDDVLKSNPAVKRVLVTPAQISRYPAGSVQRAFFEYWSTLQFQSWLEAVDFYTPGLRRTIGTARLVEGLKVGAPFFRGTRPLLIFVTRRGGQAIVRYVIRDPTFGVVPRSISFRRVRGRWEIVFDSALDALLQTSARTEAQAEGTAARAASRAGAVAGRLQSAFLAENDPGGPSR